MTDANIVCMTTAANCIEALALGLRSAFGKYKPVVRNCANVFDPAFYKPAYCLASLYTCLTSINCDPPQVTGPMIEKLKERKQTVVDTLMGALVATFNSVSNVIILFCIMHGGEFELNLSTLFPIISCQVSITEVIEDVTAGTAHKNPQVRAGTVGLVTRRLKTIKEPPSRGEVKTLSEMMLKTYEDGDASVREASAEGLGTLMKCVGEKAMIQYMENLEDIKKAKVKEFFEKAEVKAKPATAARKPPPPVAAPPAAKSKGTKTATAKASAQPPEDRSTESPPPEPAPTKRKPPAKAAAASAGAPAAKKPVAKATSAAPPPAKKGGAKSAPEEPLRYKFTPEDAEERAPDHIPAAILAQLADSAWKTRLAGNENAIILSYFASIRNPWCVITALVCIEALYSDYGDLDIDEIEAEIVIRTLGKKPGFVGYYIRIQFSFMTSKLTSYQKQVLTKVFEVCQLLASKCPTFSKSSAALAIPGNLSHISRNCKAVQHMLVSERCVEKLGDIKLKKAAGDCLTTFVEKTSLQFVFTQYQLQNNNWFRTGHYWLLTSAILTSVYGYLAYDPWKKLKAPKALADSLTWIHATLMEFGITGLQVRELIEFIKFCLSNSNAAIRTNAVTVLGALRLYIGPVKTLTKCSERRSKRLLVGFCIWMLEVKSFVQDVNPTLLAAIEAEFAKVAEMEPPKPTKATVGTSIKNINVFWGIIEIFGDCFTI
ncbi:hypothetical protein BC936DRAFT_141846 [Jimgerdemannia flammicorona]|uniref:TOG domain-containing protein n=1 Tax=Jimgerdemannia flammicorona TaxID=994334 RepID=A0A433A1J8_9FUNG|nr:hypothetical protein BC936DRAFT_141846 [Jimgerdemannia flammicorona]